MPRKPRQTSASGVYHFVTRGVNKKKLFHKDDDYKTYLLLVKKYGDELGVQIHHYCLMTNHVHLVLKAPDLETLGKFAHFVQRCYAYYYCKTYKWSEQVFRRNYSSFPIESDAYLLECGRYVERNPLTAKLVGFPEEHPYVSYRYYAYGKKDSLITESPVYSTLGASDEERRAVYRFYVTHERASDTEEKWAPF